MSLTTILWQFRAGIAITILLIKLRKVEKLVLGHWRKGKSQHWTGLPSPTPHGFLRVREDWITLRHTSSFLKCQKHITKEEKKKPLKTGNPCECLSHNLPHPELLFQLNNIVVKNMSCRKSCWRTLWKRNKSQEKKEKRACLKIYHFI